MENKRMFKCLNFNFSGSWGFREGREYELYDDKRHPGYYTFKLSVDDGKPFICNAPKECFEEVKNIVGYKLIKPEYESAVTAIGWNDSSDLKSRNVIQFEDNNKIIKRLQKAGVLDLWFEPVYGETVKVPKVNGLELEIKGDMIFFGKYSLPKECFNSEPGTGIRFLCLEKDFFSISKDEMNEIKEYLKTI